jgi:16S rRNA pseudouridine516 synthase
MQIGSRSEVKEYIRKGRIKVDDTVVKSPDYKIDKNHKIYFDGQPVVYQEYEYFMLNKPSGVLSATRDKNTPTVLNLIHDNARKDLFPVGRLDKDTEGLLLITNDGQLSHSLLSPKKHVDKTYYAKVLGKITDKEVSLFEKGLEVDSEFTAMPAKLTVLDYDSASDISEIKITIHEGKFHQIKRMFEAVGSEVVYLKRLSMGTLKLDESLAPGEYRKLTEDEINKLYKK